MSATGPVRATTADKTSLLWETPPEFFAWRTKMWRFDLDAAANADNALLPRWFGPGAPEICRAPDDALAPDLDWTDYGDRFCATRPMVRRGTDGSTAALPKARTVRWCY